MAESVVYCNAVMNSDELTHPSFISEWTMDFCSILKLARVGVGNVVKRVKIWKVLLLEVFFLVGFLTKLCLYIYLFYSVNISLILRL